MNANDYWTIFLETGAPEMYLMFNQARKMEEENVFNGSGACPTCQGLQ